MFEDVKSRELTSFSGPWKTPDAYRVPGANALAAENVRYVSAAQGSDVATRFGHSVVWSPNDAAISALFNWLYLSGGVQKNALVYYAPTLGVRWADLSNPAGTLATIIAQAGAYAASFTNAGSRLYAAFFNSSGIGAYAGQVYNGTAADALFAPPLSTAMTITEPGAGVCTAGAHRLGYLVTSRSGFTGRPSPVSGEIFSPASFTCAGSKNLNVQFSPAWPAWASSVQIVATTASNLNKWFLVPGATASAGGAVNVTFSISDDDLQASGTDATPYFNQLTQTTGGAAPFNPATCFVYSSRMAYVAIDSSGFPVCYFSEPDNYQSLFAATSGVYLPGNLQVITGFALRGVAYLIGPHWTYSTSDDGSKPAQWAKPQLVDGSIGTLSVRGVCVDAAQGFAWVADESGLYFFQGGAYPNRPISYYQATDWARINWGGAAQAVQVVNHKASKRVMVYAPLDGATSVTHRMVFDYTNGTSPESAQYSLDPMSGYAIGAAGAVQNNSSKKQEIWLAPSAAGSILRENDGSEAQPYRDAGAAIAAKYETSLLPGQGIGGVKHHHGFHLRVRGAGNLALKVYSLDHVYNVVPPASPIALSSAPDKEILFRAFLQSEHCSLELSSNALDSYFILALLRAYWTPASPQR